MKGRPSEKEILTCRLIDRPIRPLFPDGFYNEVQIVATVVSSNNEIDSDIPAMIGASAALALSGIPFNGPIGAARVGYLNGQYVLNPTATELKTSQLDLVVAGTEQAVLMVESEAKELPEDVMLGAVVFGHQQMQAGDQAHQRAGRRSRQRRVGLEAGRRRTKLWSRASRSCAESDLRAAFQIKEKQARSAAIDDIWTRVFTEIGVGTEGGPDGQRGQGNLLRARIEDRAQPDPERRAAHRRARYAHRAPDLDPHRARCRARTAPRCSPGARPRRW